VTVAGRELGVAHSHADEESFAVGVVHGFAGSGAVVVAMAAAAPDVAAGVGFLAGFAVATVVAMAGAAWLCGRAVGRLGWLRVVAGGASVAIGLVLVAGTVGVGLPC
jgi:hydrogenase/urease accessory protein HupE